MGMFNALNLGDIMHEMIYRVRPFEVEKGKTDRVFHEAVDTLCTMLRERKPFEDHEDLPEWMAKKIRANKGEVGDMGQLAAESTRAAVRRSLQRSSARQCTISLAPLKSIACE